MRPSFSLMLLLPVVLLSCQKAKIENFREAIAGKWEEERYAGYPFPDPTPPGHYIILGTDGSYERRLQDSLIHAGSYSIDKKKDCEARESDFTFKTSESNEGYPRYIDTMDGKLLISASNCLIDGGTTIYHRAE